MIKYCIFDLDGTLLNTLDSIRYYLNRTLGEYGFDGITREECRRFIGDGAKKLVSRALESRGVTDAELCERVLKSYNKAYDSSPYYLTEPYRGIPELISALSSRGITLAVLSNKPDSTARSVVSEFFGDAFSLVRGALDGVKLKPEPDACLEMIKNMGAAPSEVAFIGDTGVDIETGKRATVGFTVGVSWGFREREELIIAGADRVADTPIEILEIIGAK